jgi:hypothetical protein
MTTTISLPTRDCIVIGCDSLATTSQSILNPFRLLGTFFEQDGSLKVDESGSPILDNFRKLMPFTESLPRNQLPSVTKIFSLAPIKAGLLFAGIASVGTKSIRNLVEAFLETLDPTEKDQYAIETITQKLGDYLDSEFEQAFKEIPKDYRPAMEILLSGYSSDLQSRSPEIFRITCGSNLRINKELEENRFDIAFGGQYDVIERVVKGIDVKNYCELNATSERILQDYHAELKEFLKARGIEVELPVVDLNQTKYQLFGTNFGGVRGIFSDISELSEQAAINFVEFLINTMINAQEFSDRIPTVGGEIHLALITKASGFRWISKEEYRFRGHSVPKYEHH